jgi:hypothetical protein
MGQSFELSASTLGVVKFARRYQPSCALLKITA